MGDQEEGPNAKQVEYWNEVSGPKWVRLQSVLDRQLEGFIDALKNAASLDSGQSVLDVGCGCGTTTLTYARHVGSTGGVTGVDISAPMLARAKEAAREASLDNVRFEQGDAQVHAFDRRYDAIMSRFGVMFFADPVEAFANLRRALTPSGVLAFVCWRALDRNPWMTIPMGAVLEHVEVELPSDPCAPGPFALADGDRLRRILGEAGLADVEITSLEGDFALGGGLTLKETVDFMVQMGPTAAALKDADDTTRRVVHEAVTAALEPHASEKGVILPYGAWLVTAR